MVQQQSLPITEVLDEGVFDRKSLAAQGQAQAQLIEKTLADFGLSVQVRNIHHGPRLTRFSLKSEAQISKIKRLEQDLAVALSGRLAGLQEPTPTYPYLTIDIAHQQHPPVKLRQVIDTPLFSQNKGVLKVGLGLDTFAQPVVIDLAAMPHLLIGGTTGSGKSVCVNSLVSGLVCTYTPATVRLLLIDPAQVELRAFDKLPHLLSPLITRTAQVLDAFNDVVREIDRRYRKFSQVQVRDLAAYNQKAAQANLEPMPYVVIIIDNLVDLMLDAPQDLEKALTRMAQKARGAGIHLVLATLRTNAATLSGSIKANFPGRIAFRVADKADSQLILDEAGAEQLLGRGDMLFKAPEASGLQRVQGVYVSEAEIERIMAFWRR